MEEVAADIGGVGGGTGLGGLELGWGRGAGTGIHGWWVGIH